MPLRLLTSSPAAPPRAPRGRDAVDDFFPTVYEELRRIAHRQLGRERPDHTLGTTALVHEAYLKLARLDRIAWQGRAHFLAVAAQAMRRVLVDYAVARRTLKRGGARTAAALDDVPSGDLVAADALAAAATRADELLALDDALRRLAALDERQARVVECRFFAGMSVEETAEALDVSPATVKRDWTLARAWLNRELGA
jgi:RNA polymerase sigma-70 factor, ECF subfamily